MRGLYYYDSSVAMINSLQPFFYVGRRDPQSGRMPCYSGEHLSEANFKCACRPVKEGGTRKAGEK